ncbi:Non-structural maintenance of chromosome element 4 [Neolecta irregularis DAH-3]|uniref:Non-structural maintenance of chromosomes element 4 n=1 Tax=Neolecta irregularis (strain DAH-3) TaxID=1198029 RepID=A0A1U7LSB9_NEOID|nr:Non-structural maintenance of chromosome element 4 [Neolecta irregularis DAH-3]|eukprot:OLL25565.1 Non-structural maintenance of chromosome element 4 [Neolecta irregularis DAH-3]
MSRQNQKTQAHLMLVDEDKAFYDPQQPEAERREVKKKYRGLQQRMTEERQTLVLPANDGLTDNLQAMDDNFARVKNPSDATLDSGLFVELGTLTQIKIRNVTLGGLAPLDLNELVTRYATYMGKQQARCGVELTLFSKLGRLVMKHSSRAPTIDFLLGPLSVEKKIRKTSQRQNYKRNNTSTIQPQELRNEDIKKEDNTTNNNVMAIHRILEAYPQDTGVNLWQFVINPESYSQTVENLFYSSFLVRENKAKLTERAGMFYLHYIPKPKDDEEAAARKSKSHEYQQIVASISMGDWKELVKLLNISKSVIPIRRSLQGLQQNGQWYG